MAPHCLFVPIVDGNWSEWSSWEECSRTCGQGNRTRVRTCSNPPAQHGGRACEGKAVEAIMCSIRPCPGEWRNISSPAFAWAYLSDWLLICQWLGTGVPGCLGALVVKHVAKGCRQDSDSATTLRPHLKDHHVKDLTHRHKCAMRGIALVSILVKIIILLLDCSLRNENFVKLNGCCWLDVLNIQYI